MNDEILLLVELSFNPFSRNAEAVHRIEEDLDGVIENL
jgi:hypothetical protein